MAAEDLAGDVAVLGKQRTPLRDAEPTLGRIGSGIDVGEGTRPAG